MHLGAEHIIAVARRHDAFRVVVVIFQHQMGQRYAEHLQRLVSGTCVGRGVIVHGGLLACVVRAPTEKK